MALRALLCDEPVGIQVCRLAPLGEGGIAHGVLSWVKPAYRRRGIFAPIQAAVDAALLPQGTDLTRDQQRALSSWRLAKPPARISVTA